MFTKTVLKRIVINISLTVISKAFLNYVLHLDIVPPYIVCLMILLSPFIDVELLFSKFASIGEVFVSSMRPFGRTGQGSASSGARQTAESSANAPGDSNNNPYVIDEDIGQPSTSQPSETRDDPLADYPSLFESGDREMELRRRQFTQTRADERRDAEANEYNSLKEGIEAQRQFGQQGYDSTNVDNNKAGLVCISKVLKARSKSHPGPMRKGFFNHLQRLFLLSHLEEHHPEVYERVMRGPGKSHRVNDQPD